MHAPPNVFNVNHALAHKFANALIVFGIWRKWSHNQYGGKW